MIVRTSEVIMGRWRRSC